MSQNDKHAFSLIKQNRQGEHKPHDSIDMEFLKAQSTLC